MRESVTVGIHHKGRAFLSRRLEPKKYAGKWQFPGGKADDGELIVESAVRELKEETGLTIRADRFKWLGKFDDGTGFICHNFTVELNDDELPQHTEPDAMTRWFPVEFEVATYLDSMPGVKPILKELYPNVVKA